MTSYFEIGGKIIELDSELNDVLHLTGFRSYREHKSHSAMNRESKKALSSLQKSRYESVDTKVSLVEHWKDTSFHGVSEFSKLTRREQIAFVKRPYLFGIWGIGKLSEVVGMHYDYFIGE